MTTVDEQGAGPGLFLLLLAGPGTRESRVRTLEALRLAQTLGSVGGRPLRLLLVGEAVLWLSNEMSAGVPEGSEQALEEAREVHEEFLEGINVLQGLAVPVTACTVSVSQRGLEARAMELGVPRVAFPRQVDQALQRGWQLLSF